MRQINDISHERDTMGIIVELTSAFEGIASMHISQIKDQVLTSQNFFDELWRIYSQIRVDQMFHFGRTRSTKTIKKELIILVTAEGSFSGDVDQRVVEAVLKVYDPDKNDIIVVGRHGTVQLTQRGINVVHSFKLPTTDTNINVMPLAAEVQKYDSTVAYYPTYVSLMRQDVKSIHLNAEVTERGRNVVAGDEIITEGDYIFEPSTVAVVSHLENSMLQIMLSQIILESKLAQYASRFRAMHAARDKADDSFSELSTAFNQARRHNKDERIKEIVNGLRKVNL
ncbi:MAG TPA: F0F1 ATP synthase subunit gamma [Candidatus Saccharimonadales bacterium]|nr:F0F1 ATP synthase subunit gamma [Candidatus Saccharimonadales bacterium]